MTILRKFLVLFLCLTLGWTTVACGRSENVTPQSRDTQQPATQTSLSDGKYPVQQASYDDGSGEYSVFLLNTPPGTSPNFRAKNLQLARLTDEQVKAGQQSYLNVENGQPALYLTQDFKIEYVRTVSQTQTNSQGQQEVVVRREGGGLLGSLCWCSGRSGDRQPLVSTPVLRTAGLPTGSKCAKRLWRIWLDLCSSSRPLPNPLQCATCGG